MGEINTQVQGLFEETKTLLESHAGKIADIETRGAEYQDQLNRIETTLNRAPMCLTLPSACL